MPTDTPLSVTVASLPAVLQHLALAVAKAQTALDEYANQQAEQASKDEKVLPPVAFYFAELEVDLCLAFHLTKTGKDGAAELIVAPANPISTGFFESTSFNSHICARIAPRILFSSLQSKGDSLHE